LRAHFIMRGMLLNLVPGQQIQIQILVLLNISVGSSKY